MFYFKVRSSLFVCFLAFISFRGQLKFLRLIIDKKRIILQVEDGQQIKKEETEKDNESSLCLLSSQDSVALSHSQK